MIAAILNPKLHGRKLGLRVSYTAQINSKATSAEITKTGEEVYLITLNAETAKDLVAALEHQLEWANTDYYKWCKRKST